MMRTVGNSVVRAVLDELDVLADGADHDSLMALRDRIDSARLRVLVRPAGVIRSDAGREGHRQLPELAVREQAIRAALSRLDSGTAMAPAQAADQ